MKLIITLIILCASLLNAYEFNLDFVKGLELGLIEKEPQGCPAEPGKHELLGLVSAIQTLTEPIQMLSKVAEDKKFGDIVDSISKFFEFANKYTAIFS